MRKYWCKIPDQEVKENCFWKESKGSKDKRKTVEERKQERKKERATSTKRDMEVEGRERKERQQGEMKAITDRHKVKKINRKSIQRFNEDACTRNKRNI